MLINQNSAIVDIHTFNEQTNLIIPENDVHELVKTVLALEGERFNEVSIHFVNKEKISELHDLYFNDPTPTDCISFPIDDNTSDYRVLGEVFVCPEVAIEYGKNHSIDPLEETTLYIVHGLLHLLGYDDIYDSDKKKMREAEKRHMKNLAQHNLILKEVS